MLRQFSAAWIVAFTVLALVWWFIKESPRAGTIFISIAPLGVIGLLWPRAFRELFILATIIAYPIGLVVTQVVLGLMFFVVITPIGLWLRLRGRDELQLKDGSKSAATYWQPRGEPPPAENYLKQY